MLAIWFCAVLTEVNAVFVEFLLVFLVLKSMGVEDFYPVGFKYKAKIIAPVSLLIVLKPWAKLYEKTRST